MILAVLLLFCIANLFYKTDSQTRRFACFIAFGIYIFYSGYDYIWLCSNTDWPFHPSDPSAYYQEVVGKTLYEVLSLESSNTFYYIVNWINWKVWQDPFFCSAILRLDNILAYIAAYLLLTHKSRRFDYIDLLLLFNPFTIVTMVRNVRDIYIILFVIIALIGLGLMPRYKPNKIWTCVGILLLLITRAVLLLPIFWVYYESKKHLLSKKKKIFLYLSVTVVAVVLFPLILHTVANQMISAIAFVGEDIEPYLPLLNGNISLPVIKTVLSRLLIGLVSFLFTPHPINFYRSWVASPDWENVVGIYTLPDNMLIFIGSIFNYLFVIPLFIYLFLNRKNANRNLILFACAFIVLYVVSYLGVVDIRNRNTAIFFILAALFYSTDKIRLTVKHYIFTLCIFCGLFILSA